MSCGVRHSEFVVIDEREKQSRSEKGQPLGYAGLDANGKVPANNLDLSAYATDTEIAAGFQAEALARGQAIAQSRQAIEQGVAQTYATKAEIGDSVTQQELEAALGPYVTETEAAAAYASKAELGDYVPLASRNQPSGVAGLSPQGKVSPDVVPYKAQGKFEIDQNISYSPANAQGYAGVMRGNADCNVQVQGEAIAGPAQIGGITAFYKIGLGRLTFSADANVSLIYDTRFMPEADSTMTTLTYIGKREGKDEYVLGGSLKLKPAV